MQKCSYCGLENTDETRHCRQCGVDLSEKSEPMPAVFSMHHVAHELQRTIWEKIALQRRRFYLAGALLGAMGSLFYALEHPEEGFRLSMIFHGSIMGAAFGLGGVWLLTLGEKLQKKLNETQKEGRRIAGQKTLFVILLLLGFVGLTFAMGLAYVVIF